MSSLFVTGTESFVRKDANLGRDLVSGMGNKFPLLNTSYKFGLTYNYPQVSNFSHGDSVTFMCDGTNL